MTNNEILSQVLTFNIKGICVKYKCFTDIDDIEQSVYFAILNYDNKKLNQIVQNGALLSFCYRITTNTISNKHNYRKRFVDINDYDFTDNGGDPDKDEKMTFLENQILIDRKTIGQKTIKQQRLIVRKILLHHKFKNNLTIAQMGKKFDMSSVYMGNLLRKGIKDIKRDFFRYKKIKNLIDFYE